MSPLARRLFGLGVLCALIGAAVGVVSSDASDFNSIVGELKTEALAAFHHGAWRWLARAGALSLLVALVLVALDLVLSIRRPDAEVSFDHLDRGTVKEAIAEVRRRIGECTLGPKANVITAFGELMRGAVSVHASDVHVSPTAQGVRLTYRVHGTLHDVIVLDASLAPLLATRVKVLARLDTYVRGTPQDGRLVMQIDGATIEARVSTLPTETGERLVLRIVRGSRTVPDLEGLGFSSSVTAGLKELLTRPQGLIFVTGPVGSGKSTSLYASLKYIAGARGRTTTLVTLEDPIELELPFATQTQMNPRAGMTFASTLRSVLRQDPNVLMVGEIRDRETAEIAAQAGLSGHLIVTTVHAESAAGPFARLIDIGIEPFILASATLGCLSQRLVRSLCVACRKQVAPEPIQIDRFLKHGVVLPPIPYYEAVGCDFCESQGFTAQTPIGELLV
ncbi:MAG TPA: GspE/PulE family protein, partial [Polyangiaceae bacterium]